MLTTRKPGEKAWDCVSWKAIRLPNRDLLRLREHADENARFWMFHGKQAAVEDIQTLDANFILIDKQLVLGQKESYLSIYHPRKNPECLT